LQHKIIFGSSLSLSVISNQLSKLDPPEIIRCDDVMHKESELNLKVYLRFNGSFCCEPCSIIKGSDVERCFSQFLYLVPKCLEKDSGEP
jgi:hypothetical protein